MVITSTDPVSGVVVERSWIPGMGSWRSVFGIPAKLWSTKLLSLASLAYPSMSSICDRGVSFVSSFYVLVNICVIDREGFMICPLLRYSALRFFLLRLHPLLQ